MGIRIDYQPVNAIGEAAYLGGLGQYQQRQQELFLRQQQLDQQAASDRDRLAAQMANQQLNRIDDRQRMGYQAGQQAAMEAIRHQNDLERLGLADQYATNRDAARRREELADDKTRAAEAEAARLFGYESRTAEDMAGEVDTAMANYAKQRTYFTPEGSKAYTDLATKWGAIVKQRPLVRPQQFGELVGQFREEMARANIDQHIQTPKPTTQSFQEETVEIPGKGLFSKDRSGAWRQISKEDKSAASERPGSFQERYRNFDDFQKDYDATFKAIWDREKQEAEAKVPEDGGAMPVVSPPDQAKVLKEMKAKFDAYQSIQGQGEGQEPTEPQPPPVPPPPMPGQPSTPPPPRPLYSPAEERAYTGGAILADLPRIGGFPVAPSPEIAAMLPPGTVFVTPDGRRMRVPVE